MEKYVNEIPLLVRNSIKALSDDNRQGILIYLEKKGPKSFIEISKELKISKNNLSHHLKILMLYGLIYNFYNRNEFADKYSFYEISKLGKRLIDTLVNFITQKTFKEEESYEVSITAGESTFTLIDYATGEDVSGWVEVSIWEPKAESLQPVVVAGIEATDDEISHNISLIKKLEELQIGQEW